MPRQTPPAKSPAVQRTVPTTSPFTPTPLHVEQPTLGQTIKQGFGFGVGTSLARNLVDRAFASPAQPQTQTQTQTQTQQKPQKSCKELEAEFNQCIKGQLPENTCQDFLERYNQCKQ
jgi:hypothetical protein